MSEISDFRNLWKSYGGEWHGPKVERWSIPEDQFCAFMDAALDAAEADKARAVEAERRRLIQFATDLKINGEISANNPETVGRRVADCGIGQVDACDRFIAAIRAGAKP